MMFIPRNSLLALLVLTFNTSCMSWMPFSGNREESEAKDLNAEPSPPKVEANSKLEQLELKNAKLWTRLDELEEGVARQREQIAVLEQGLNLGIKPMQLSQKPLPPRTPSPSNNAQTTPQGTTPAAPANAAVAVASGQSQPASNNAGPSSESFKFTKDEPASPEYEQMFAKAHEKYLAGRFGPAIVDLSDMEKKFGQTMAGGIHVYWIGRCWLALKEYSTARSRLEEFLKSNAQSPYVARANVDLAKAEYGAGLNQTALKRLQTIIEKHPYEDAAELARYELEQMKRSL